MKLMRIDKKTAVGCQIDTAIELIFRDIEELSVVTLLSAAWGILHPMMKKERIANCREILAEIYSNNNHKLAYDKLNEFPNYLKHSDRDADKDFQFPPEISLEMAILVIIDFKDLFQENSQYMKIFYNWWIVKYNKIEATDFNDAIKMFPDLYANDLVAQKKQGLDMIACLS